MDFKDYYEILGVAPDADEKAIPPGVYTGARLRLAGMGQPGRYGGPAGDLYARVRLMLPEPLSERELQAFRELAAARRGA
jgi:DnaJ-class molecular chaperone